jgi:hypothetical protein
MYIHETSAACDMCIFMSLLRTTSSFSLFIATHSFIKNLIDKVSEISTDDSSLGNRILGQY